jgi:hypothetical protein
VLLRGRCGRLDEEETAVTQSNIEEAEALRALLQARGAEFSTPRWHWAMQKSLPRGLSFSRSLSWLDCSHRDGLRQARRFAALGKPRASDPQWWLGLIHRFADPCALRLHVFDQRRVVRYWLILAWHPVAKNGTVPADHSPLGYGYREVRLDDRVAWHHFLVFVENAKGAGKSAQVMANAASAYVGMGVERIKLIAGLTAGSAVWPKFGFAPSSRRDWEAVKTVVRRNLAALDARVLWHFENTHGRPLRQAVEDALSTDDPRGMYDLVDLDESNAAAQAARIGDGGYAAALLAGGHWEGELDLNPVSEAWRRLDDYLAKKSIQGKVDLPPDWPTMVP